jgi:hypothetical protein
MVVNEITAGQKFRTRIIARRGGIPPLPAVEDSSRQVDRGAFRVVC